MLFMADVKVHEPIFLGSVHGEYKDDFGNVIYGECENCRIYLHGSDNYLNFIGADITGSDIHIGEKCIFELGGDEVYR